MYINPTQGIFSVSILILLVLLALAKHIATIQSASSYNVSIKLYQKNAEHQTFYQQPIADDKISVNWWPGDAHHNHHHHGQLNDYHHIYHNHFSTPEFVPSRASKDASSYRDNPRLLCLILGICTGLASNNVNYVGAQHPKPPLTTVMEWRHLEFDYENEQMRQADLVSGFYKRETAAPIDVDVFYREQPKENKIFISIPRFQTGSPVTLASVSSKVLNGNPVLTPFPSWSWHRNPESCRENRLVSVYRIKIDKCGRLWVLDTGRYGDTQTCPPQILAFDLQTNALVHKFTIPSRLLESRSILVTLVVDIRDGLCRSPFIYVADCQTYSIIVHDVKRNVAWKATDKTMYPFPDYGTFSIQGDQFDLMDGVLGMDLEPYDHANFDRKLFYHAMSSGTENWVFTSFLRNESMFKDDPTAHPQIFQTLPGKRPSQSCALAIDKDGVAYFGLMSETSINCWNTINHEYGSKSIETVYRNPVTMQFASGVKVISNLRGGEELWVLTSRFQKVATASLNLQEINFRISAGKLSDLLQRTRCKNVLSFGNAHSGGGGYGFAGSSRG